MDLVEGSGRTGLPRDEMLSLPLVFARERLGEYSFEASRSERL